MSLSRLLSLVLGPACVGGLALRSAAQIPDPAAALSPALATPLVAPARTAAVQLPAPTPAPGLAAVSASTLVPAFPSNAVIAAATLPDASFPDQSVPRLSAKEVEGLRIAEEWKEAPSIPAAGANGKIVYLYGSTLPSVVCSPLFPTDIELQPGEIVSPNGLHLGDSVRWTISPATSGTGPSAVTHLVIKPQAAGLITSILVATNRRTYHIKLVSSETDWMPYVSFAYPDEQQAQWQAYEEAQRRYAAAHTLSSPDPTPGAPQSVDLHQLDFSYRIEGRATWAPLRVYNDGVKTVLQMPTAMSQTEAPALLVLGSDQKEQLVNYRVIGDRYIVDQVFEQAALIAGVGRKQQRVTITRQPDRPANRR